MIGKPGGYAITTPTSKGLEAKNVDRWLLKRFSVFFVPEELVRARGAGVAFTKDPKLLFLRVVLDDQEHEEPMVYFGVLWNIENRNKKWEKVETSSVTWNTTKLQ